MENLIIEGTKVIPRVFFETNGTLLIKGRAIPVDSSIIFNPMIEWVKNLKIENVNFTINLEYFNTSVSKKLMELFLELGINLAIKKVNVSWHYEEGDDDIYIAGERFQEILPKIKFKFIEHAVK